MNREIKFEFIWKKNTTLIRQVMTLDEIIGTVAHPLMRGKAMPLIAKRQFTGLTDKNGVEIYDGDIVSLNNLNQVESSDIYFQVKWCNDTHGWIIYHNEVEFYNLYDFDCWVIGNIHQNPELLK